MKKFARRCDLSGKGMNKGWVWGDGTYYTSTIELTIKELRDDIKDGAYNFDELGAEKMLQMSDDELLEYAYNNDIFYFTEWKEITTDFYYDEHGNEYHEVTEL